MAHHLTKKKVYKKNKLYKKHRNTKHRNTKHRNTKHNKRGKHGKRGKHLSKKNKIYKKKTRTLRKKQRGGEHLPRNFLEDIKRQTNQRNQRYGNNSGDLERTKRFINELNNDDEFTGNFIDDVGIIDTNYGDKYPEIVNNVVYNQDTY